MDRWFSSFVSSHYTMDVLTKVWFIWSIIFRSCIFRGPVQRTSSQRKRLPGLRPGNNIAFDVIPDDRTGGLKPGRHIDQPFDRRSSLTTSIALLDRIASQRSILLTVARTHNHTPTDRKTAAQTDSNDAVVRTVWRMTNGGRVVTASLRRVNRPLTARRASSVAASDRTQRCGAPVARAAPSHVTTRYNCCRELKDASDAALLGTRRPQRNMKLSLPSLQSWMLNRVMPALKTAEQRTVI